MKWLFLITLTLGSGCASKPAPVVAQEWQTTSEKLYRIFGKAYAPWTPEAMSQFFPAFESKTIPYSRNWETGRYAAVYKLGQKFEKFARETNLVSLKLDALLIAKKMELESLGIETARATGEVPFVPLTKFILDHVRGSLKPGSSPLKIKNGLTRFRSYVRGTDDGILPLADGLTAFTLARLQSLESNRMRGFWPQRKDVLDYLNNYPKYLNELEKVLSVNSDDSWKRDFSELELQDEIYRSFLMKKILPFTRKTHALPEKYYAFKLRQNGVSLTPKELREFGHALYKKSYVEFRRLLVEVAREKGLQNFSAESVFAELRKGEAMTAESAKERIQSIIKEHKILAMDEFPVYREHSVNPTFKDEGYKEAILNLVAREIYPGKELRQWITETGILTKIRKLEMLTPYNTESWARYAEELIYPYLTQTEQLVFLQNKLLQTAKLFLDPEYHLGLRNFVSMNDLLMKQLGYSEAYTKNVLTDLLSSPGKAPSFYAGHLELIALRDSVLTEKITERCWNDYFLSIGILPIFRMKEKIKTELVCDGETVSN